MKILMTTALAAFVALAPAAFGQSASSGANPSQVMGRGRGGAPYAWNDKNKDGICDLTGKPVGQGRMGAGRGFGRGRGRGPCGAGMARGMGWRSANPPATPQAPAQPKN